MLSVPAALVAALEDQAPLIAPPWVFALVAFACFLVLGLITWSFRDVANRHSQKTGGVGDNSHADAHGSSDHH